MTESKKKKTSIITLQVYVDILRLASIKGLPHNSEAHLQNERAINELISSGLLSNNAKDIGVMRIVGHMVITPEGAMALAEWSEYMWRSSLMYKVGDAVVRFLWVLIGAGIAVISDLSSKL